MKNIYIKIAGILNLLVALLHLIGGQVDLVHPLLKSGITVQQKAELVGAWHIITVLLFYTSYYLLRTGFSSATYSHATLRLIGMLYVLIGLPFIGTSIYYAVLAPQWILLMPIGVLVLYGLKDVKSSSIDHLGNNPQ